MRLRNKRLSLAFCAFIVLGTERLSCAQDAPQSRLATHQQALLFGSAVNAPTAVCQAESLTDSSDWFLGSELASESVDTSVLPVTFLQQTDSPGSRLASGSDGNSSGGTGAGAAAATDPSVPLAQFQIQNIFTPE